MFHQASSRKFPYIYLPNLFVDLQKSFASPLTIDLSHHDHLIRNSNKPSQDIISHSSSS